MEFKWGKKERKKFSQLFSGFLLCILHEWKMFKNTFDETICEKCRRKTQSRKLCSFIPKKVIHIRKNFLTFLLAQSVFLFINSGKIVCSSLVSNVCSP